MPSSDSLWHIQRRKKIIKEDPSIQKEIEGPFYPSALIVLLLVSLQWYIWYLVETHMLSPLKMLVAVYLNINTALYALSTFMHENSHGLVLGWKNRLLVAAMIELGFLSFGEQWEYTMVHYNLHHPHLNDNSKDSECPGKGHVAVSPEKPLLKIGIAVLELLPLGTLITLGNLSNNAQHAGYQSKTPQNVLICVSLSVLSTLVYLQMYRAAVFVIWSATMFASRWNVALHGQSIAEHYHHYRAPSKDDPPTFSTYYKLENVLGFNTGYHDEHHTFPNVPWVYLPVLKERFPEVFCSNGQRRYLDLWWEWAKSGFGTERFRMCRG